MSGVRALRLVLFLLTFQVGDVYAQLKVCNKTSSPASIAIGYQRRAVWISEGWFMLPTRTCRLVITKKLTSRFYYFYGSNFGGYWRGRYSFCVTSRAFTIYGDKRCRVRRFRRVGFDAVDTGTNSSFTLHLTDQSTPKLARSQLSKFLRASAKVVAFLAHPTATYVRSSTRISKGVGLLYLTMRSRLDSKLFKLTIRIPVQSSGLLGKISVVRTTSLVSPFLLVEIAKKFVVDYLKNALKKKKEQNKIVNAILKKIGGMSGVELCFAYLQGKWVLSGFMANYKFYRP